MGAGILPVAIHKDQIYFLFGKDYEKKSWSDFGGSREKNETLWNTAIREGCEELNGFLGSESELRKRVKDNLISLLETNKPIYRSYIFKINYNPNLPIYFNNNFKLMKKKLPDQICKDGLFEKSEIKWVALDDLHTLRYRSFFYHQTMPLLMKKLPDIKNSLK